MRSDTDTSTSNYPSESSDSDLEELNESFNLEDAGSQASPQVTADNHCIESTGCTFSSETPLYPGAPLSSPQRLLLIFQYAMWHSLSKKAFTELLQLLSVHLPKDAQIPKSVQP